MEIHLFHCSVHIFRQQTNFGMLVLEDNEKLMGKALTHPLKSVKIQRDLFKTVHAVAKPLCLRTGYGGTVIDVFQRNTRLCEATVRIGIAVKYGGGVFVRTV